MYAVEPRERSLGEALGLGEVLLSQAEAEGVPWLAASVVRGPAVVLSAAQRAGRVVRLEACAAAGTAVLRRATSGTAAYVGARAIVWTLALPHVAALVPDATPRTLLNRNLRGFLRGLGRAGAVAHYFGREWIAVKQRPAAIVGFEARERGAVLIEVIAGLDAPVSLPAALATEEERAVDRWRGKAPVALSEVMTRDAMEIAREVMKAVAPIERTSAVEVAPVSPVTRADDPMLEGFVVSTGRRVPIGWIDTGRDPASRRVWIGGDVLAPAYLLRAIAEGARTPGEVPLEGATLADLVAACG